MFSWRYYNTLFYGWEVHKIGKEVITVGMVTVMEYLTQVISVFIPLTQDALRKHHSSSSSSLGDNR